MLLEHPALEPFEPLLKELRPLVFRSGIQALVSKGLLRHEDELRQVIEHSRPAMRRFMRGCHYGYDLAQRKIGAAVLDYEIRSRVVVVQIKDSRRAKNFEEAKSLTTILECLRNRQLVLRRLIDSILNLMVKGRTWILRHSYIEHVVHEIDPKVLQETLIEAAGLNAEDRMSFHLVSDLTTAIQVGDLVRLSLEGDSPGLSFIELKSGKINEILAGLINETEKELSDQKLSDIGTTLGPNAVAQAKRMVRQNARAHEFTKLINTDEGMDIRLNLPIKLTAEEVEVQEYSAQLRQICKVAAQAGVGAVVVGKALRLVAVNEVMARRLSRDGLAHTFFHLQHPTAECKLPDANRRPEELDELKKIWPFFDMVSMNCRAMWPKPLFLWPMPFDMILDLLFGRVRVFGQIDFDQLFDLAKARGIEMRWFTSTENAKVQKLSYVIPGSPGALGVCARLVSEREQLLLSGFFGRILLELMSPTQLLETVVRGFDQFSLPDNSKQDS